MSNKPAYPTDLNTLELTELIVLLKQDYAELIKTSVVLRKEGRQLREDSRVLRSTGTRLLSTLSRSPTDGK